MDNSNIIDEETLFIIENAGNTCYIDSVLMALFYFPSHIDGILKSMPKNIDNIYLQEYIQECFVDPVRNSNSVFIETMDTLRYICIRCGWKNLEEAYDQHDIAEFYTFLMELFNSTSIEIKKQTFTNISDENSGEIEELYYIPLSIPYDKELDEQPSIKHMLYSWLYDNKVNVNRTITGKQKDVEGLNVYHLQNIPDFVSLSINRFPTIDKRLDIDVKINKKICPFKHSNDSNFKDIEWSIHSVICHKGDSLYSGHYYSLLKNKDRWYRFDDQCSPCLYEVTMDDKSITSDIKKDSVFIIYKLGF